jgi:hypothetical protein
MMGRYVECFRKGYWRISVDGKAYRMYNSIPHSCDLDVQRRLLVDHVRRCLQVGPGLQRI